MSLSIVCILIVGGMGWLWLSRGFYSAILNLVCALIAGAVAFGVWESVAYALLERGQSGDLLPSSAWAIGLALPYAVTLGVTRFITDKVLRANVKVPDAVNYVGGALCGAASGAITAGIIVISLGMLRVGTEFMGFQAMGYGPGASLKRESSLLVPVDKVVARLYDHMSRNALATDTPLAVWQPHVEDLPSIQRINYGEGASRNTLRPDECDITGRYTLGGENARLSSLLTDEFNPGSAQEVADLEGERFPDDARVEGVVVTFKSGAKEKGGQVIIGAGQVRLVALSDDGTESLALHPIAAVSRTDNPAKKNYARFRFDARELYIPSVGGDANTTMAFEFVVPKGFKPAALYLKSTRFDIPAANPDPYATPQQRDAAIKSGTLVRQRVDEWEQTPTTPEQGAPRNPSDPGYWGVEINSRLPEGITIQDGTQGPNLEISERKVINGSGRYDPKLVKMVRDVPRELQVTQFKEPDTTVLVQVNVSKGKRLSFLGKSIDSVERILPPQLVSTDGQVFEAIGYYYEDETKIVMRYTIGQPIRGLSELDNDGVSPTVSRADQKLILIFAPSKGVEIKSFNLGSKALQEFERPIPTLNN